MERKSAITIIEFREIELLRTSASKLVSFIEVLNTDILLFVSSGIKVDKYDDFSKISTIGILGVPS